MGWWILHDHGRVILQPNHFQIAIVDGQALRRGEGLVVAGRCPHVGVARQHVVVLVGLVGRDDVVHRILVSQRPVHRPGIRPGCGGGQLERNRRAVRHIH